MTLGRRLFVDPSSEASRQEPGAPMLTPREKEILKLLCGGKSNKEIGHALDISRFTVKSHLKSIFFKMGVNDRTQASVTALRQGLVDLDNLA